MTISKIDFTKLSDAVADIEKDSRVVQVELELLRSSTDKLEQRFQHDFDKADHTVEKIRDQVAVLQAQVAVLQTGFDDLKKRWEESDRRRWTSYGIYLAATLTFVANLALLLLRR